MLEFTEDQVGFLYRLLDQVSVSGEENKAMIVEIMRLLRANIDLKEGSTNAITS